MFNTTYTLLKTIVQRLWVQKLLIFYSLDYPTKVTPNVNNIKKHPQSFVQKKALENI
jgi:hypothetical protein